MYFGLTACKIKVSYVSPSHTSSFNMGYMDLVQMQDGLYFWLWDSDKNIGLIIPESE